MIKSTTTRYFLLSLLCPLAQAQIGIPDNMTPQQQERQAQEQALEHAPQEEQMRRQEEEAATPKQHMQVARNAIIQQLNMLRQLELELGQINSPYTANRKASTIQALSGVYQQNRNIELQELQQLPPANMREMEHMYQEQISPILNRVRRQVEILSQEENYYDDSTLKNATFFLLR